MRVSLTIRFLFFIAILSSIVTLVQAQTLGGSHESELAMIRPLIVSGNQKARDKDYDGAIADFTKAIKFWQNALGNLSARCMIWKPK